MNSEPHHLTREDLKEKGFAIAPDLYDTHELASIIDRIGQLQNTSPSFMRSSELYAVRQLFRNAPELKERLFNNALRSLVLSVAGPEYFISKSIFFDKTPGANWFVAFHQDLSVSVDSRHEVAGYSNWTQKRGQVGVQPPVSVLENIITLRIHLDETDEENGALYVIPGSHKEGLIRKELNDPGTEEVLCKVPKGGVMLMKPLALHRSGRAHQNAGPRRVIHIELASVELDAPLNWLEKELIFG